MNFGELCQEVYTLTNRPELVNETQLALRRAAIKFHSIDFWLRDKVERTVQFTASSAVQLDVTALFERFRKFGHLAPFDPVTGSVLPCYDQGSGQARGLKEISPAALFDPYNNNKNDVFYLAGNFLNIKFGSGQSGLYASWYKYPLVQPHNFNSWIAELYPYLLVDEAAGYLFTAMGQIEDAMRFTDPVRGSVYDPMNGHLKILRTNELEALAR